MSRCMECGRKDCCGGLIEEQLKAKDEECERLKSDVLEWCRNGIALLAGRPCTPTEKAIKESMNLVWSADRVNKRYDEIFKEDMQIVEIKHVKCKCQLKEPKK